MNEHVAVRTTKPARRCLAALRRLAERAVAVRDRARARRDLKRFFGEEWKPCQDN